MGRTEIDQRHSIISPALVLRFLIIFLPFATATIAGASILYWIESDAYLSKQKNRQLLSVELGVEHMGVELNSITDDLAYLATEPGLVSAVNHNRQYLEADWKNFLSKKQLYDQIRLIDTNGREQIRVNFNRGFPKAVPPDKLQSKFDRYYFSETMNLNKDQLFISPLDLNVEQGIIERPHKPTLRIATPLFKPDGQRAGVLILNILGKHILDAYTAISSDSADQTWLVNQHGYWLKGPSKKLEWGFMFHRKASRLGNQYPDAWKVIRSNDSGQFENKQGLWSYATAHPSGVSGLSLSDAENSKLQWKAVRFISKPVLYKYPKKIAAALSFAVSLLLLASFFVSLKLTFAWAAQRHSNLITKRLNENLEQEVQQRTTELQLAKQKAELLACTDELTGISNHRAFYNHAEDIQQRAQRYGNPYSIIIFDLDHFKKINDSHGHLIGDKVLRIIGKLVIETIRSTDFAGRIGGEEFAIILPESDCQEALELAERLRRRVAAAEIVENDIKLKFTASFGVSEYCADDDSFESVLHRSDGALYQAKESGRNRVIVDQSIDQQSTA